MAIHVFILQSVFKGCLGFKCPTATNRAGILFRASVSCHTAGGVDFRIVPVMIGVEEAVRLSTGITLEIDGCRKDLQVRIAR